MLQYLINASATWLVSLILFDLFLRRESYHNYNRFYLLFTFLLGALLPLWQWQGENVQYGETLQTSVEQVLSAKRTIVATTDSMTAGMEWQQWLLIAYAIGALAMFCILVIDIVKLNALYRNGKHFAEGRWTVIATGKDHAPFSILNVLFVSSRNQYNEEEWAMIIAHERRHTSLLHFADLVLMQLAHIIFWFHPLVYIYNKRLLLVHEYQADNASSKLPKEYGAFLLEQAMLNKAPSITHSFNRSPIKNRLIMLTRRSSAASRTKMLVFIPLALVCTLCFSKNSFSKGFEKKGNKVTYHGNTFELSEEMIDTITITDPVTGEELQKIVKHDPQPVKMNNRPIIGNAEVKPYFTGNYIDLRDYLLKNMKKELLHLKDGNYSLNINDIVVDEKGKIVYFHYQNMKRSKNKDEIQMPDKVKGPAVTNAADPVISINAKPGDPLAGKKLTVHRVTEPSFYEELSKENQEAIFNKVCKLMDAAPKFMPGKSQGKPVITTYDASRFWNHFRVKDGKIYDADNNGEFKEL